MLLDDNDGLMTVDKSGLIQTWRLGMKPQWVRCHKLFVENIKEACSDYLHLVATLNEGQLCFLAKDSYSIKLHIGRPFPVKLMEERTGHFLTEDYTLLLPRMSTVMAKALFSVQEFRIE